jgi:hypothetical protein
MLSARSAQTNASGVRCFRGNRTHATQVEGENPLVRVPSAGIEPATRGLGNPVMTAMGYDLDTFPLVDALRLTQSLSVNPRC